MQDSDLIEIKVSRVLHAEKWKIIRLLTRVAEFPSFVPTVKEASIVRKNHNKITTRWHIQVDSVPIKWVEEDTLDLKHNSIRFKAVEGDLTNFEGSWVLKDHSEGNELIANVRLKIDIPVIKNFAQPYISKMVTRNFEAILEGLESRLISLRYLSYQKGDTNKIAGFGIIGHLYNFCHLEKSLKLLNPDFKMPSREFIGQLFHVTPSFKLYDIKNFKSKTGQTVNGCFIVATFIPDMVETDIWGVYSKVVKACKIAEKYGIGVVTLGGFASILSDKTEHKVASEINVPLTTGDSFTAALVLDGIDRACAKRTKDLSKAKVVLIGGTSEIGCGCARVLSERVKQLTLVAFSKERLKAICAELSRGRKAKIIPATLSQYVVEEADIVVVTANTSASYLPIEWFKGGSIVCDAGYPKNVNYYARRKDIFIFSGDLAQSPTPIDFPIDMGLPDKNIIYGSFAEGIILALEKRFESFSPENGEITPEKINLIRELGKKHGFTVADFYWSGRLLE
ncbi:MAG: hypothetical protein AMJ95_13805 [Omnitrophica WOR_2 bacterium SM23_72]|nr:MAG: hypothetical protein AMJ95_13805 [Omnitrophica WOR_2 bacterium SM23_72]